MADQTITTNTNHDDLTGRNAGENITINDGANLTIDSIPQRTTMGILDGITCTWGTVLIDGRNVKEVSYASGSGTLPSVGDTVTDSGGASGKVIWLNSGDATSGVMTITQQSGTFSPSNTISDSGTFSATISTVKVGFLPIWKEFAGTTWVIDGLGTLEIKGEWYELGTGDGTDSQTVTLPIAALQGCVWVETGNGTGVFEKYLRKNSSKAFTEFSTDDLGRMFDQPFGSDTITFGTSTNGNAPASGARLRVPNVHISCATLASPFSEVSIEATVSTSMLQFSNNKSATFDLDRVAWSGTHEFPSSCGDVTMVNSSIIQNYQIILRSNQGEVSINNVGISSPYDINYKLGAYLCYRSNNPKFTDIEYYKGIGATNGANIIISQCTDPEITNSRFITDNNLHDKTQNVSITQGSGATLTNVKCINMFLSMQQGGTVTDFKYSDTANGVYYDGTFDFSAIAILGGNVSVDGVSILPNGSVPVAAIVSGSGRGITIRNIGTFASPLDLQNNTNSGVLFSGVSSDVLIQRCYFQNSAQRGVAVSSPASIVTQNCGQDYTDTLYVYGVNVRQQGLLSGLLNATLVSSTGCNFQDIFTSDTTGAIYFIMTPPSSANDDSINTVGGQYDGNGYLFLPTVGNYAEFTFPYEIKGHTGFQNVDVTIDAVNPSNFTIEYAIDDGSGYGVYKSATGANLSAETVSTDGLQIKVKVSCNTSNTTNKIRSAYLSTTSTSADRAANLYPLDPLSPSTLTFNGVVSSNIQVMDDSGAVIEREVSFTGDYSYTIPAGSAGTWCYVINRAGYDIKTADFSAEGENIIISGGLNQTKRADGSPMYSGIFNSPFLTVTTATDGSRMNLRIGDGAVSAQVCYDEAEDALMTEDGMRYICAQGGQVRWDQRPTGTFLDLGTNVRLIVDQAGFVNSKVEAIVSSTDGVAVDGTNGSVQFAQPTNDVNVVSVNGTATTGVDDFKANVSSLATQASVDTIDANVDAILVDTNATIPAQITGLNNLSTAQVAAELANYDAPTKAEMDAAFTEIKGPTFSATDTLEAIRDRGDSAWITATGFATPTNVTDAQSAIIAEVDANEAKIDSLETKAARLDALIENVTGDRFTAKALETAPTAEMDANELHTALDSYTNKANWMANVSALATQLSVDNLNNVSTADIDARLTAYGAPTLAEMTAAFTEIKGATWSATDTLEAIRDAITAEAITAADVWANGTRTLTAGTKDAEIDAIKTKTDQLSFTGIYVNSLASNMRGTDGANTVTPDNASITSALTILQLLEKYHDNDVKFFGSDGTTEVLQSAAYRMVVYDDNGTTPLKTVLFRDSGGGAIDLPNATRYTLL